MQYLGVVSVVLIAVVGAFSPGCDYQLQQCQSKVTNFDQRVSHMESLMAIMEGRSDAIADEFKRELTVLSNDVTGLVDDNVKIEGKLRFLQGVDGDVQVLRKKVTDIDSGVNNALTEVRGHLNTVSNNLEQQADAQRKVSVFMNTQMNSNKELLQSLNQKMTSIQNRITALETKMPQGGGAMGGNTQQLNTRVDGLEDKYDSQIRLLQQQLQEMRRALM